MTTGSTTTSSENTTQSSDNHSRPTIEPMATENMDPSWNTPTNAETNQSFTAPSNIHGNTANYVASPTPMGTSNENRARPKAGRNLLGVSSSSSPFSPRFVTLLHYFFVSVEVVWFPKELATIGNPCDTANTMGAYKKWRHTYCMAQKR